MNLLTPIYTWSNQSLSAPVGQSSSRGGGANRLERITALARDQRPVQDEIDQIADMANNQANLHILENLAEYRDEDGEPSNFQAMSDSITEDIETEPLVGPSNGVSRPGPSTDVMSKPGPIGTVSHNDRMDNLFDYYIYDTDTCECEDDDNNNNDNGIGLDNNEGDDNDSPPYREGERDDHVEDDNDNIEISDDDIDNDRRKKRQKKSKWEERQDLKWENSTKKCLYEAASSSVIKSHKHCFAAIFNKAF